jgi:hypothetical protein
MAQTTEATSRSPTQPELLRLAIEYHTRDLWTAMPGKVTKYDPVLQKADVKPLVQDLIATEDGEEIVEPLPIVTDVPIMFPRAGGFFMTMPVRVGDFCTLVFCSRSIDKYLEGSGGDVNPADFRTHDLSDAVAFLGMAPFTKAIKADGVDEHMVLGKEGGVQANFKETTINLGSQNPADAVGLASLVKAEIVALRTSVKNMVAVFDAHTHVTTATVSTGSPGVLAKPATGQVSPPVVGDVDSKVVLSD